MKDVLLWVRDNPGRFLLLVVCVALAVSVSTCTVDLLLA